MRDTVLFSIGVIAILLIIGLDINNFKKNSYEPKIFRANELSNGNWLSLIAYIVSIIPIVFMQQSVLKGIFALLLISLLIMDKTILNITLYKSKKVRFNMFETFIFDIILIFFGVVILIKFSV